jgi:hypothetical protein
MATVPTASWEFEAADPEVGFLSDTITHACLLNVLVAEPAEETGTTMWNLPDGKLVRQQTVFTCPRCKATTTMVEDWPRWMFEEPRDEEEGR